MKSFFLFNGDSYKELSPDDSRLKGFSYPINKYTNLTNGGKSLLLDADVNEYYKEDDISFSSDARSSIVLENSNTEFVIRNDVLKVLSGDVYVNAKKVALNTSIKLKAADDIFCEKIKITNKDNYLVIFGVGYASNLQMYVNSRVLQEEYPVFKRSARIVKRVPEKYIELNNPPQEAQKDKGSLVKLIVPPLITLAGTIVMGIFMRRGPYVYIMALSTLVATTFSITSYFQSRKEHKEEEADRVEFYEKYLLNKRKELDKVYNQQIEALTYQNPNAKNIEALLKDNSNRLYERNITDGDFLNINLGYRDMEPTYKLSFDAEAKGKKEDPMLVTMREIGKRYSKVPDMPYIVDLKRTHLGLVGDKSNLHYMLRELIAQMTFLQSYHDVEFIFVMDRENHDDFSYLRWYPHFKVSTINVYGLIDNDKLRDHVLGSLTRILKNRKEIVEEKKKESIFSPFYVFIIDNQKLIVNHAIMEYLENKEYDLGFRTIFLSSLESNIPEHIKTTVIVNNKESARVKLLYGEYVNLDIGLYSQEGIDYELMSRLEAPISHIKGITSQIPKSVTFFEMLKIRRPDDVDVEAIWNKNSCHKSLAVPLGLRAQDDIVQLNLHEKAHGPHGLVAGTTGSGKSEIIQSYILSLALHFSPYDVGFLLIDYKGGGMANLFTKLPHLLGTITNLDKSQSMRALASIRAELSRRERIFGDNNINNINQYTKKFKAGEVAEPLPHLFIISDEFAELKKEQPEFMSELVSTARIGRSLGVHLILATQKPRGVVDDQIWSNSKFKLALKVQDESDSKEVLKTPDAAHIVETGRAYLQVGNNEIYELFQSAWSGAPFREEQKTNDFDSRIYLVNDLGQGELLNEDLSDDSSKNDTKLTELDVLVDKIKETYESKERAVVSKPWLPPLADRIVSPVVSSSDVSEDIAKYTKSDLVVSLGIVDLPEQQAQKNFVIDINKEGNFAVFSSVGFGKTMTLSLIALELATKNSPELLNYYLIDFGNSGLVPLKNLPHVADYVTLDDKEKQNKLIMFISEEIKKRKSLFSKTASMNLNMYNSQVSERLPNILLFIDNYDAIKDVPEFEAFMAIIARDGNGLGINLVIGASRFLSVKSSVLNNIKRRVALYLNEKTDILSILGRFKGDMEEIKGRGLIKDKEINTIQIYVPFEFVDEMDYVRKLLDYSNSIAQNCTAKKPKGLPVLPETLAVSDIKSNAKLNGKVPIGLELVGVETEYVEYTSRYLVVAPRKFGKTNTIKVILEQLLEHADSKVFVADFADKGLIAFKNKTNYVADEAGLNLWIGDIAVAIEDRKADYANKLSENPNLTLSEYSAIASPAIIVVENADQFVALLKGRENEINMLFEKALSVGIGIFGTTVPGKLAGIDNLSRSFKKSPRGILIGNPAEQNIFPIPYQAGQKKPDYRVQEAFLLEGSSKIRVMVPNAR